jgi:secondary thiamine-phosphate synthase enzyme
LVKTIEFSVKSTGNGQAHDVTEQVAQAVEQSEFSAGIVTVFVPGSTAAITTIEFEPGAVKDLADAIERVAPKGLDYAHNAAWGDGNGHSHVRAAMIGPSLAVPFAAGLPILGTWQQVVLLDFDNRARERRLVCQVMGE